MNTEEANAHLIAVAPWYRIVAWIGMNTVFGFLAPHYRRDPMNRDRILTDWNLVIRQEVWEWTGDRDANGLPPAPPAEHWPQIEAAIAECIKTS